MLRRVAANASITDQPLLDVVFVHGLGGDDRSTWTAPGATESWLDWLAQDIPSIAVWSLRYPAVATKWTAEGEGMALPDRATNLIPTLLHYEIGSRSTVFVGHSLGGLVVKQILRHSNDMAMPEWKTLTESTVGVAFLATPHAGSTLASLAYAFDFTRPTKTTLALRAHCPHLKELSDWYRQNASRLGIETVSFAESRRLRKGFRLVTVVTTTSADPGIAGCVTTSIDANHINICKPTSRTADPYRGIEAFVRRQLSRASSSGTSAPGDSITIQRATSVEPPAELVRQVQEILALGEMELLDPFEVKELKMGILNRHYGVNDD